MSKERINIYDCWKTFVMEQTELAIYWLDKTISNLKTEIGEETDFDQIAEMVDRVKKMEELRESIIHFGERAVEDPDYCTAWMRAINNTF